MNVLEIRADFPILSQHARGKPLVYLDSAATAQKPKVVMDAIRHYYENDNANVHRSVYELGERATAGYEGAREKVATFIGSPNSQQCIFVKNTTEAINLVAHSVARRLKPGDEVLVSPIEHHSNLVPWQVVTAKTQAKLRFAPILSDGRLDIDSLPEFLNERTRLVAITQVSNVLGVINPVKRVAELAHKVGARVLVDGAQSVPHMPVNVVDLDCDFLAFSGHKMCGPTGIGVLYGKKDALNELEPLLYGGEMISNVTLEEAGWNELPWRLEGGTPNIAGAIGLGAAVDYLSSIGLQRIEAREKALTQYAMDRLSAVPGITIYGPKQNRGGLVTFNVEDIHPHDVATILDQEGVAVRAGHHCAQPVMAWLGVPATVRASFYLYNTEEEIDALVGAVIKVREFFGNVTG